VVKNIIKNDIPSNLQFLTFCVEFLTIVEDRTFHSNFIRSKSLKKLTFHNFPYFLVTTVLGGQFEQLGGGLLVQSLGELVDGRRNLQSLLENRSLPLELDVGWPSNESGQISFWLDILANAEVLGSFFKERVG